jgi:hypothetical protein
MALVRRLINTLPQHRDLHWGNILVAPADPALDTSMAQLTLDSEHVSMPEGPSCLRDGASTIRAAIIDFTLSRATVQSENVLSGGLEDESIFDGHGESSFHPSMV